ncbi:Ribbon-helix-helix protein CopG domain-containing protein [Paraburkholderia kururiensis]|uniref:plasmid mobilization protein n=1 Tax=Paraburkholderia kururiensis TaxID=984307 RepID=UPI0039A632BE
MNKPSERIVVFVTPAQKRAIAASAEQLGISVSELMRRAVLAYGGTADQVKAASIVDRLHAPREPDALAEALRKVTAHTRTAQGGAGALNGALNGSRGAAKDSARAGARATTHSAERSPGDAAASSLPPPASPVAAVLPPLPEPPALPPLPDLSVPPDPDEALQRDVENAVARVAAAEAASSGSHAVAPQVADALAGEAPGRGAPAAAAAKRAATATRREADSDDLPFSGTAPEGGHFA